MFPRGLGAAQRALNDGVSLFRDRDREPGEQDDANRGDERSQLVGASALQIAHNVSAVSENAGSDTKEGEGNEGCFAALIHVLVHFVFLCLLFVMNEGVQSPEATTSRDPLALNQMKLSNQPENPARSPIPNHSIPKVLVSVMP